MRRRFLKLLLWVWALVASAPPATLAGVQASPRSIPDLSRCAPYVLPCGSTMDCCIHRGPAPPVITDWTPPPRPGSAAWRPPRVRRPLHQLDARALDQLARAFQLQAELPEEDPRSAAARVRLHCAYSSAGQVYKQLRQQAERHPGGGGGSRNKTSSDVDDGMSASSDGSVSVHFNPLFLPFHRMLTLFQERTLGALLGDSGFAMPFWQWDDATPGRGANLFPAAFADRPALAGNASRSALCRGGAPAAAPDLYAIERALVGAPGAGVQPGDGAVNDALVRAAMGADSHQLFLGREFGAPGAMERVHGAVHFWVGDYAPRTGSREDMGEAYSATRDPVFFPHHANTDRLWEVWKRRMRRRGSATHPDHPDFLDSQFLLIDERGRLVRVRVRDALASPRDLGYVFQRVRPASWMATDVHRHIAANASVSPADDRDSDRLRVSAAPMNASLSPPVSNRNPNRLHESAR